MGSIRHEFVNAHADGADDTVVQPTDWNDPHSLTNIAQLDAANTFTLTQAFPNAGVTFGADVNLYRASADTLKTDDQFKSASTIVSGDGTAGQLTFSVNGTVYFGADQDTNLYRSAANTLKTDDAVVLGGALSMKSNTWQLDTSGNPRFFFDDSSGNTYIRGYSSTAAIVFRDSADNSMLFFGDDSTGGRITFGSATDTNLYRSAANSLATDDAFSATNITANGAHLSHNNLTTDDAFRSTVFGDLNYRFVVDTDGKLQWGDGTLTTDTNLYRSAANQLSTDDSFISGGYIISAGNQFSKPAANAGDRAYESYVSGDSVVRYAVEANGVVGWGPGNAALDTNLYRYSANALATDDDFVMNKAAGSIYIVSTNGSLVIGGDTNLYRSAADILKTDDAFIVGGAGGFTATAGPVSLGTVTANDLRSPYLQSQAATGAYIDMSATGGATVTGRTNAAYVPLSVQALAGQSGNLQNWNDSNGNMLSRITALGYFSTLGNLYLQADGTSLFFGASSDTNLYRAAADTLKTDDDFKVAGVYYGGAYSGASRTAGDIVARRSAGTGAYYFGDGDVYWYYNSTNISTTVPTLHSSGAQQVYIGAIGPGSKAGLTFSNNEDVNLYRDAAGILKTDHALKAAQRITGLTDVATPTVFADSFQPYTGSGDINFLLGDATGSFFFKSASAQSDHITKWADNSNNVLAYVNAAGAFGGTYFLTLNGGVIMSEANAGGYIEIDEATGDASGAADKVRLFCKDVAGKTKLYAVFQTGAIVLVATEP